MTSILEKIKRTYNILQRYYDTRPDTRKKWKSSVIAELISLICSQNTTNQWSSLMYTAILSKWPNKNGCEPDWNNVGDTDQTVLEITLRNGPYFRTKARHILTVIRTVRLRFATDDRNAWVDAFDIWCESNKTEVVREYLLSLSGIGRKTSACVLLYRLRRVDFAIDTNILRIGTRLGWFEKINLKPQDSMSTTKRPSFARRQPEGLKKFANKAHRFILDELDEIKGSKDVETLFQAHFILMLHGEVSCYASKPKCHECPVQSICPAANVHVRGAIQTKMKKQKSIRVFKIFPKVPNSIRFVDSRENVADVRGALVYLDESEEARLRRFIGLRRHHRTRFVARLFVTPSSMFQNTFPMRGTHFLPNEVFLHRQRVSVDLESFFNISNRLHVRIIQLGASARTLYANTLPKQSSCRVFSGKFVCLREVTTDRRLDRLDLNLESSRKSICNSVLSGLVNHVVRNEENATLKKQREVLMRLRRMSLHDTF